MTGCQDLLRAAIQALLKGNIAERYRLCVEAEKALKQEEMDERARAIAKILKVDFYVHADGTAVPPRKCTPRQTDISKELAMKITLESTDRIITVNGAKARVWEGQTATGIPIFAAIATIAVHRQEDDTEFERELTEHKAASEASWHALPLRFLSIKK